MNSLPSQAEPISDQELAHYFVAPGYYGADVAAMREYERQRAEFRKIQVRRARPVESSLGSRVGDAESQGWKQG